MLDLSDTILAKSDRLNAEDLISGERIIIVTKAVKYIEKDRQAFYLNYEGDNGRPYKPSKGMRVVITAAWGKDGDLFIGRSIKLYYDPKPWYAGKEAGGIRINAMSDLPNGAPNMTVTITERKNCRVSYFINLLEPVQKPQYPAAQFTKALGTMSKMITAGDYTAEQVINKCEQTGWLTDEQKIQIRSVDGADLNVDEGE